MITIYWPQTLGESLGFGVAVLTALLGLLAFVAPRMAFQIARLEAKVPDAIAEGRASFGGVFLALGLGTILLSQPLVTLVLGGVWAMIALGRLVSMVFDGSVSRYNIAGMLFELVLAAAALAGPLNYIA
jgi:dipeptide/tripeptide permease